LPAPPIYISGFWFWFVGDCCWESTVYGFRFRVSGKTESRLSEVSGRIQVTGKVGFGNFKGFACTASSYTGECGCGQRLPGDCVRVWERVPAAIDRRRSRLLQNQHPTRQPANQPTSQPASQPANQPANQPTSQPANQAASQPGNQAASQPGNQASGQPGSKPIIYPGLGFRKFKDVVGCFGMCILRR